LNTALSEFSCKGYLAPLEQNGLVSTLSILMAFPCRERRVTAER